MAFIGDSDRIRWTRLRPVQLCTLTFSFVALAGIFQLPSAEASWADETLTGSVEGGKFAHYTLSKAGRVTITVTPKQGDPDVYVGENGTDPDFDLDRHTYQSTTCGVERIVVSALAVRPIGIGIYGHPSHEYSVYELNVRVDEGTDEYETLVRGESTFDMMDDESYSYDPESSESRDRYSGKSGRSEHHYSGVTSRRKSSYGGFTSANRGGGQVTDGGPTDSSAGGGGDDSSDWEDWEEYPVYSILLTLLRLFWEMLLTL